MASWNPTRAATRIRRLWARLSNPPLPAARPRVPTSATAARIHAFTRGEILRRRAGGSRVGLWLEWTLWYAQAPFRTLVNTAWNGPTIRARTGKGLVRQAREQMALAFLAAIPPKTYYRYRLHEAEARARAGDYLLRSETKATLYRFLRPPAASGRGLLNDKLDFARECRAAGVRAIPTLMEVRDGRVIPLEADALPPRDLVVKPRSGRGGRDVERWLHRDDGRWESSGGRVLDAEGLLRRLRERSRKQPYLVQPRLVNHPELADLGRGVLTTVRVLTCTNEAGEGEVTHACLRIGGADPVVDNMHRGGGAAAVDLATGRLGPAIGSSATSDWWVKDPATGAAIAGRLLPDWPAAIDLVCRAHRIFSVCVVIGWDVALLEDGPCLVEGNRSPCVSLIQRPLGGPIGGGRFGELVAHRIALLEATRAGGPADGAVPPDVGLSEPPPAPV